jgi:nucleoside 2-deoxyribosyltransferase
MRVVGGIYQERCFLPRWDQIFGSAGRAACVISAIFGHRPTLSGWYSKKGASALAASFAPYGINLDIFLGRSHYVFAYAHPLSHPDCYLSGPPEKRTPKKITDDVILLFGAIEGVPSIQADKVILDPQGENLFDILDKGIISANQIAIVANEREIALGPASSPAQNIRGIFAKHRQVATVVVKRGAFGATIFDRRGIERIPAYVSQRIFKIGSGDVFSAVFSYMWGKCEEGIIPSVDAASRSVACYVGDPYLNFKKADIGRVKPFIQRRKVAQIYLAAPFFSVADFLILAEARRSLIELGAEVFSPFHHVGFGETKKIVAKDLRGLSNSRCVLALLETCDPGTLFEVGYARAKGIPVIAVGSNNKESDITMLAGTNCIVESDFCTAAYKSIWTAFGAR